VLISEVGDGILRPRSVWSRNGTPTSLAELEQPPLKLEYPLIEEEVVRRQSADLVVVASARSRAPARLARVLGWDRYVVAALTVDGSPAGLLHADATDSGRALDELDREIAELYCEGLAGVFERAVLRETLRRHRSELRSAVQWMSGRLTRLSAEDAVLPAVAGPHASTNLESLTKRGLDVLRLMARGQTNQGIADALLVREGTVKYHVKNILRKLGATSRADAVARYLRASARPVA
jgi:DNA-binding CsgD family transcriptional regulator